MIKIIETNLSIRCNDNEIMDSQSRVVEVESWESYIEEIKNGITVVRSDIIGCCHGASVPNGALLSDLKINQNSLMYDAKMKSGNIHRKLAYKVGLGKDDE